MSLIGSFSVSAAFVEPAPAAKAKRKRPAPFAIRLSADERTRLEREAAGAPLGTYIKAKALGEAAGKQDAHAIVLPCPGKPGQLPAGAG